jgi:hypothetical protein
MAVTANNPKADSQSIFTSLFDVGRREAYLGP